MAVLDGELLERLLDVDGPSAFAVVTERLGKIIGVGRAHRSKSTEAEVAFTVSDRHQHHGIGTLLLEALADRAAENGIEQFVAVTQADNVEMLHVFRNCGLQVSIRHDPEDASTMLVELQVDVGHEQFLAARRKREQSAVALSLQPLLAPRSIAVIGVSTTTKSPGRRILDALIDHEFAGHLVAVNPHAENIGGVRTVPTVADIGDSIDLAIIAVPASSVESVARECGEQGVRALLVISAGFAEIGDVGRNRQQELLNIVRSFGMRLIGPNCLGVVTTSEDVRMHAVFANIRILPGHVALMSQSGAVALAIAALAAESGLGLSSLVSVGNKADVSGNDLLDYWDCDPRTKVIALYLESFGNPRTFARRARDVGSRKPIVAIKSARSTAGSVAATSHTGALTSQDSTVDALFEQTGVLRVDDPGDLVSLCSALSALPLPAGRSVAVVGNAGGLSILTVDAMSNNDLVPAQLSPATTSDLRSIASPNASLSNPVDLTADATPAQITEAVRLVLSDEEVDAVIVDYVGMNLETTQRLITSLAVLAHSATKPILTVLATQDRSVLQTSVGQHYLPTAASPTQAALVIAKMADRFDWLQNGGRPETHPPTENAESIASLLLTETSEMRDSRTVSSPTAALVFKLAGIRVAMPHYAASAESAAHIASEIGFPVCLKAANPNLKHRSDEGAVWTNLKDEFGLDCAFRAFEQRLGASMEGVLVQPMAAEGVEMIVGIINDPAFGPLVMVGAGGREAEIWKDSAVHLAPVSHAAALNMVSSLRSFPLLSGFRGSPPADIAALVDIVVRVARLAADFPSLEAIDANPVIVHRQGATAVDVKIKLSPDHLPSM